MSGSGLRRVLARLTRWLPEPLLLALLPRSMRYDPASMVVATPPQTPVRLLVTPVNFAGQGDRWARAAERLPGVGAFSTALDEGASFGHSVDLEIPVKGYIFSRRWQDAERAAIIDGFTHVLVEAERRPYGRTYDTTVVSQVRDLVDHGVRVAMVCHGSDIRLPSSHREREPDSPFAPGLWDLTPTLERQARENRAILDELGLPVFVSTPDMLHDVPGATWLPVVIEPERWGRARPLFSGERPVVVHAPSRAAVKGSDLIEPALSSLHESGEIEYRRIEGVPAADMPEVFGTADIVLEQFRLGIYSVTAVEALASGCVVMAHVDDFVRGVIAERTGHSVPIVQSRGGEIVDRLREVIADRDRHIADMAERVAFAAAVHDGSLSAEVLRPFLCAEGELR